jgi:hypothetical protein
MGAEVERRTSGARWVLIACAVAITVAVVSAVALYSNDLRGEDERRRREQEFQVA